MNDIEPNLDPKQKGSSVKKELKKRIEIINDTIINITIIKGTRDNCHLILRVELETRIKSQDFLFKSKSNYETKKIKLILS